MGWRGPKDPAFLRLTRGVRSDVVPGSRPRLVLIWRLYHAAVSHGAVDHYSRLLEKYSCA